MGGRKNVEKKKTNAARGNVPTATVEESVTVNMGDYNSLHVGITVSGIDISSPEATKRELETGDVCVRAIVEFTDQLTGEVLTTALGEERSSEFQVNVLQKVAEAQAENGRKSKAKK